MPKPRKRMFRGFTSAWIVSNLLAAIYGGKLVQDYGPGLQLLHRTQNACLPEETMWKLGRRKSRIFCRKLRRYRNRRQFDRNIPNGISKSRSYPYGRIASIGNRQRRIRRRKQRRKPKTDPGQPPDEWRYEHANRNTE